MKTPYGVALIGCGQMGEAHIREIYDKESVTFEYACDTDPTKAKRFQRRYGAKNVTTDPMECIQSDKVQIVIIATYPSSHLSLLKLCLAANKHVLCEKPIATSLQEGQEFTRLVKANPQCKVLIGHILRHNLSYQKIAEMIQNNVIGHPIVFRMVQNHHTMNWERYLSLIHNTSPIVDCGVHYVDVIEWFTGSHVREVMAAGMRTEESVPENRCNYGIMTLQLEDGSVGYYEAGWSNTLSSDNLKEFAGPKGRIRLIYRKDRQINQEEGDLIELYRYPEKKYEVINLQSDRKPTGVQFDYLIRMIETDCPAVPSVDQVLHCFEVTLEAEQMVVSKASEKSE